MTPTLILVGALSIYHVGDGMSGLELACGGRFKPDQEHIAIRQWRGRCGAKVRVCAAATGRCVWSVIKDAGPFGCVNATGRWRNCVRGRRAGESWRGVVDLSRPLWIKLGRPPFLSRVRVEIYTPRRPRGLTPPLRVT